MPFLEWSEELDVKVNDMNDQHAELIRLMNAVHDANECQAGKVSIQFSLDQLVQYVVRHFAEEEAYMASIGFPKLDNHKRIHKQLLERVSGYKEDFETSDAAVLPEDFFRFLRYWLVAHIKGIDIQYGQHSSESAA